MCRLRKFLAVIVTVGTLIVTPSLSSAAQNPTQSLSEEEGVKLIQTINTAELEFRIYSHTNVGMVQLLHHRWLKNSGIQATDASTGTIKNYRVTLLVSQDGAHYSVALTPANSASCGFSLFSDESGLGYEAKAIGCSEQPTAELNRNRSK